MTIWDQEPKSLAHARMFMRMHPKRPMTYGDYDALVSSPHAAFERWAASAASTTARRLVRVFVSYGKWRAAIRTPHKDGCRVLALLLEPFNDGAVMRGALLEMD